MKNALILHGTNSSSRDNWFPWLRNVLELQGWKVWSPDLPGSDKPDMQVYMDYILGHTEWNFDQDSLIIGHSSGAVAGLGVLQHIHEQIQIKKYIGIGAFHTDLGRDDLKGLFKIPMDYEKIKRMAKEFLFIHSDNDKAVPLVEAEFLTEILKGNLIVKEGQGHFNLEKGPEYKEFPFLLQLIEKKDESTQTI
jgi:uncharacterized protein